MKVFVLGASGNTGKSIIDGLNESSTPFDITALTRPSSLDSPKSQALRDAGIKVVAADLSGPQEDLVAVLKGADVVISAVTASALKEQIPLASAAKAAGVKRFVPCSFATVSAPRGVMKLSEIKDDIFAHIKALYLPFTSIDVGWWHQLTSPGVPSGRLNDALAFPASEIFGNGEVPSAVTNVKDIGRFVARIIADERTLNKQVFAYGEVLTQNQVWDIVEKASGEKVERNYVSNEEVNKRVAAGREALAAAPDDMSKIMGLIAPEYHLSWGIRGDNTPEYAKYLGYLDARDLYPDLQHTKFSEFIEAALEEKEKK